MIFEVSRTLAIINFFDSNFLSLIPVDRNRCSINYVKLFSIGKKPNCCMCIYNMIYVQECIKICLYRKNQMDK